MKKRFKQENSIPAAADMVFWQCTTEANRWVDKTPLPTTAWDDDTALYIDVDQATRYQAMTSTPWGGCFAERGWEAMKDLTAQQRNQIVGDLFGDDGLRLTEARMPLGNSDFSINRSQSYDELPAGVETDYNLDYFSIDPDRAWLMPYIREAMKFRPDLPIWGSPWSPPSWMKTNKTIYNGGSLIWTEEILNTYARYFAKYIQAYRAEGFNVYMVMPQNEPTMNTAYSSCIWTGAQLNEFVRDYLAPTLRAQGLDTEIYLGTFTDSQANRTDPTLNDPVTSTLISGIGVQWWSAPLAKRIYRQNTGLTLMQSETKCGNGGNSWTYAEEQFDCMREFLEAGVNSYMLWNMVLDEKGENTAPNPWHQNAPIIVNSVTNAVSYSPQYHEFKHFSYYIDGGARRIKTAGNYVDKIAFQNADGENVLVVKNGAGLDLSVAINFNGRKIKPTLPAHSISTFRISGDNTDFATSPDAAQASGEGEESLETLVKFHNLKSGKTLSIYDASFDNGAKAIAWTDQGTADQTWTLEESASGCYRLINFNSLKALGIYGGSTAVGANAVQWDLDGSTNQQWQLIPVLRDGTTFYRIQNLSSGLYLAFAQGSDDNGAQAVQTAHADNDAQLWEVTVVQGKPLDAARPLLITNVLKTGTEVTGTLTCNESGDYTLYCASYDADNHLIGVSAQACTLSEGSSMAFTATASEACASVACYGWRNALEPAAKKTPAVFTEDLSLTASGQNADALHAITPQSGLVSYTFDLLDIGAKDGGILIGNSASLNAASGNYFASGSIVLLFSGGKLYTRDSATKKEVATYTGGTRTAIRIEANITANTYDLYVDQTQVASDVAFRTGASSLDTLALVENGGGTPFQIFGFLAETN